MLWHCTVNNNELFVIIFLPHRETWEKVNLTFHDNGTLTYNQQKVYRFDPEQSVGSEDDIVVVPNIPMLVSYIPMLYRTTDTVLQIYQSLTS